MKTNRLTPWLKQLARPLLLALLVLETAPAANAALYQTGQSVTNNFYFVARKAFTRPDGTTVPVGGRVYIRDFAGRIVFLEWFAVWCPYCVAAAPQVTTGIVNWYGARGGNPYGVPVLHIAVNQESSASYQSSTDNFVNQQAFNPVVNDYDGASINPVRFMFQSGGQPTFVIINGVTNSPTHAPWQILVNEQKYGTTDFNTTLAGYRAIIDTVQPPVVLPPPPLLTVPRPLGTNFEFTLNLQTNRGYRVEVSTNLVNWTTLRSITSGVSSVVFRDTNASATRRFYRAVTP